MNNRERVLLLAPAIGLAIVMVGCGSNKTAENASPASNVTSGSLVVFGTDQPTCDVESFSVTITSAALVPQGGGAPVSVISSSAPVTVDFARLVDFATILGTSSVNSGTYSQLQLTITNPQLTVLEVPAGSPAGTPLSPVTLTNVTFSNSTMTDSLNVNINPALTITGNGTSGLVVDFNLRQSVQTNASGQVTGVVDPQFTITPSTSSNGQLGEADTLQGVVNSVNTTGSEELHRQFHAPGSGRGGANLHDPNQRQHGF